MDKRSLEEKIMAWRQWKLTRSVAEPGSGAFLAPGSGMGKKSGSGPGMNNPDHIS
jgi:hypothetical protein